jgi:hypothetical protein
LIETARPHTPGGLVGKVFPPPLAREFGNRRSYAQERILTALLSSGMVSFVARQLGWF